VLSKNNGRVCSDCGKNMGPEHDQYTQCPSFQRSQVRSSSSVGDGERPGDHLQNEIAERMEDVRKALADDGGAGGGMPPAASGVGAADSDGPRRSRADVDTEIARARECGERPQFVGWNFSGAQLEGLDLSNANLAGANLSGANLSGVNLKFAYLSDANLSDANLAGANLANTNLTRANVTNADLTNANLSSANMRLIDLQGANLTEAQATYGFLSDANLADANLERADFQHANLFGANLCGATVKRANLTHANLEEAGLVGVVVVDDPAQYRAELLAAAAQDEWNRVDGELVYDGMIDLPLYRHHPEDDIPADEFERHRRAAIADLNDGVIFARETDNHTLLDRAMRRHARRFGAYDTSVRERLHGLLDVDK